jgi:hypothetical protein
MEIVRPACRVTGTALQPSLDRTGMQNALTNKNNQGGIRA